MLLGMGMVFQQFNLFPHLTVLDNIMLAPALVKKRDKKECESQAMELLKTVGLEDKRDATPTSSPADSSSALPSPGPSP